MTDVRVATCQFEPVVGDVEANLERIEQLAEQLPTATAFAVFPELCVTGYDLDVVSDAKTAVPGPVTDRVRTIAKSTGVDLVVGLPEAAGDDVYNSLVYVSDQGVEATYRKQQSWGDEAARFTAGAGPTTVDTSVGRVGFLLCYDLNFPELALAYDEADCDLLAVSAAWRQSFAADWRLLCRARALDQTCYVVASNHTGSQSGRHHAGESLVVGPRGDTVAKTTDGMPTVSVDVVTDALETARKKNPVRRSRRVDADSQQR
jgi:predicted amidohydrolase